MSAKTSKGRVAVIGAGFWGTAISWHLTFNEYEVDQYADDRKGVASKAAAGIICKDWYKQGTVGKMLPGWWKPTDLDYGLEWLSYINCLKETGETFYNKLSAKPKDRPDCYLAPSCKAVLGICDSPGLSIYTKEISHLESEAGSWRIYDAEGYTLSYKAVVIAAGAFTDALLARSGLKTVGVRPLVGRAVIVASGAILDKPITVLTRPYTHFTLRPWPGDQLRLGDTVEKTGKTSKCDKINLRKILNKFALGWELKEKLYGLRPVCDKIVVEAIKPGLIVATGGHRVGLGLAGGVGRRVVKLISKFV